jgi:Xaa-Pro aminopeptidase
MRGKPQENKRLAALRQEIDRLEVDAFLVSQPENRRYISGFTGSAGYLLVSRQHAVLATDFRYTEQSAAQAPDFHIYRLDGPFAKDFAGIARSMDAKRIAFESTHLTHAAFHRLEEACASENMELVPTEDVIVKLRAVKEPEEIARIERAIALADAAFERAVEVLRPGMTERQVALEIERTIRDKGGDGLSFDTIVGAGPNGAMPHHLASDRPIREGEPIVMDLGAKFEGYCSDLTRTVFIGAPDDTYRKVYRTVSDAQRRAIEGIRAGMTGAEADALARDYITEAGYGDAFGHSLGHGVGLEIHEGPRLGRTSQDTLEPGMMFTIEPGIYLPGWGGVRIEDVAILDDKGLRVLSKATREEL